MTTIHRKLIFLFAVFGLMACHRVQKPEPAAEGVAGRFGPRRQVAQDSQGAMKVFEQVMSAEDLQASKAAYGGAALVDDPLGSGFGVSIKKVDGIQETPGSLYIEPSLQIYHTPSTPLTIRRGTDGRFVLSFYGSFFDGLADRVPAPAPESEAPVAKASRVNESERLKTVLERSGKVLRFLPGCLQKLELKVGAHHYPVQIEDVSQTKGGHCDIENRIYHFSVVIEDGRWAPVVSGAEDVALTASYQVAVPLVTKKTIVSMARSSLQSLNESEMQAVLKPALGARADEALKLLAQARQKPNADAAKGTTLDVEITESENVPLAKEIVLWWKLRPVVSAQSQILHLHKNQSVASGIDVAKGAVVVVEASQIEIEKRVKDRSEVRYGVEAPGSFWVKDVQVVPCENDNEPGCTFGKKQADVGHWEYHLFRSQDQAPEIVPYVLADAPLSTLAGDFFGGLSFLPNKGGAGCEISSGSLEALKEEKKVTLLIGDSATCAPWQKLGDNERVGFAIANRIEANPVTIAGPVLIQKYFEKSPGSEIGEGPFTYRPHLRFNGSVSVYGFEVYR